MSVAAGLEADVITMNQPTDLDFLGSEGLRVSRIGAERFPFDASPYTSTIVFLVRKGNPKAIHDWDDLAKPGWQVIVPNPKTSGTDGTLTLPPGVTVLDKTAHSEDGARSLVAKMLANVPCSTAAGAARPRRSRNATSATCCYVRERGDAGTAQSSATNSRSFILRSASKRRHRSQSSNKIVEKHENRKAAKAYLTFLYSHEGQQIIAKHYFRPRDAAVLSANASRFPAVTHVHRRGTSRWLGEGAGEAFRRWRHLRSDHRSALTARIDSMKRRVLPGFGLSLGFTLAYLSLIVLIPLSAVFSKRRAMSAVELLERRRRAARGRFLQIDVRRRARWRPQSIRFRPALGLVTGALHVPRPRDRRCADRSAVRAADGRRRHRAHRALRQERLDRAAISSRSASRSPSHRSACSWR